MVSGQNFLITLPDTMNNLSSAKQVVSLYRDRISNLVEVDASESLVIQSCHQSLNGEFRLWAGFWEARRTLWNARANSLPQPPVLVLGWHPPEQLQALGATQINLLDWPGATYLQYSHDDKALKRFVGEILKGCMAPVPRALLPTTGDALKLIDEVSHWLNGRLRISQENIKIFEEKAKNKTQLDALAGFLQEIEAVSKEHQDTLGHLHDVLFLLYDSADADKCDLELSPQAFLGTIRAFKTQWKALQRVKGDLRTKAQEQPGVIVPLKALIDDTTRVCGKLEPIILCCEQAKVALQKKQEKKYDYRPAG